VRPLNGSLVISGCIGLRKRVTNLKGSVVEILFPIGIIWNSLWGIGSDESDAIEGHIRPPCNVEDSSSLVGEDQAGGTEDLIVDVKGWSYKG
jgi:hypothetical protein